MRRPPDETFTITVTAAPGWPGVPLVARLRRLLKSMLRRHGIRCLSIQAGPPAEEKDPPIPVEEER